jgi:hypothetical protein
MEYTYFHGPKSKLPAGLFYEGYNYLHKKVFISLPILGKYRLRSSEIYKAKYQEYPIHAIKVYSQNSIVTIYSILFSKNYSYV